MQPNVTIKIDCDGTTKEYLQDLIHRRLVGYIPYIDSEVVLNNEDGLAVYIDQNDEETKTTLGKIFNI